VLFFLYAIGMVYIHHSTHHSEIDSLTSELASLRSLHNVSGTPPEEHPRVAELKSQVAAHDVELVKLKDIHKAAEIHQTAVDVPAAAPSKHVAGKHCLRFTGSFALRQIE
jgi:hypothetical protein